MVRVTHEDIFEAIQKAREKNQVDDEIPESELAKGVTAREYAKAAGCHPATATRQLSMLVEAGVLEVAFAERFSITGKRIKKPVYRPAKASDQALGSQ